MTWSLPCCLQSLRRYVHRPFLAFHAFSPSYRHKGDFRSFSGNFLRLDGVIRGEGGGGQQAPSATCHTITYNISNFHPFTFAFTPYKKVKISTSPKNAKKRNFVQHYLAHTHERHIPYMLYHAHTLHHYYTCEQQPHHHSFPLSHTTQSCVITLYHTPTFATQLIPPPQPSEWFHQRLFHSYTHYTWYIWI